jgi:hypothetical protein
LESADPCEVRGSRGSLYPFVVASAFSFDVGAHGKVSGAVYRAADPIQATLILAHGAGAPQTHPFMIGMATRIAQKGVDVVTFNFLYAEAGQKCPIASSSSRRRGARRSRR